MPPENEVARQDHATPAADAIALLLDRALERPAPEGARIVALHWLHALLAARSAWDDAMHEAARDADPTAALQSAAGALHQARVALRRLRATLREHRRSLDLDEGRRIRGALRQLSRATSKARDIDVHREWLDAEREALAEVARREAETLIDALAQGTGDRSAAVSRAFDRYLDPHVAQLGRRLSRYVLHRTVGHSGKDVLLAAHLARRLERSATRLQQELATVHDVVAQDALHRIRIRLKRQRAMLAPFTRTHPAIGAWYAFATQGQDLLGAMRDAMLLAERAAATGREALAAVLDGVALGHYQAFSAQWCESPTRVVAGQRDAVEALRALTAPPGHGLPMEIERKFLLHGLPPEAAMAPSVHIEQGWLPGTVLRERLRRTQTTGGGEQCTRTVKLGAPGARIEVEEPTSPALFSSLWPLTAQARIRKRRHMVRDGELTWEVDVFLDRDLVLAEVELQDALSALREALPIPSWLAPFIVREVTDDPAYLNSVMARPDVAAPDRVQGRHAAE